MGTTVDRMRRLLVVITSLLFVAGTIGSNIGPALVDNHPILVLLLSSRNRNLFGSVPFIDALPFFTIGFFRLLAAASALYFTGRIFGERALRWTEAQVGEMPRIYQWTERATVRAGWLAVLLMPGSNIVCLLVGHLRMAPKKFFALIIPAIMIRLTAVWFGGKALEDQIRSVLDWIDQYQWWIVGLLFAVSFFQASRRKSPGAPEA
ncbi:MAG: hypothetical protein RL114_1372 [Actinomycetota bacterium]